MKNVSILGCGWLGKALAIDLLEKDYSVKGSTTTPTKLDALCESGISSFLIHIENLESSSDFFASDVLVIAITSKNIDAFRDLIQVVEESTIQKVIFISSTSVYPNLNRVITENDQLVDAPLVDIELVIQSSPSFDWNIVRFAGLLGYERHPSNWFRNKLIPQPNGFVNMIHRDDCIAIIEKLISNEYPNEVFNACSNHHPTRRSFYTYAKLSKAMTPPTFIEDREESWKIISSDKLQHQLQYTFKYDDLLSI